MKVEQEGGDMVWFIPEALLKVLEDKTRQVTWLTNVTGRVDRVFATMEKWVSSDEGERRLDAAE